VNDFQGFYVECSLLCFDLVAGRCLVLCYCNRNCLGRLLPYQPVMIIS